MTTYTEIKNKLRYIAEKYGTTGLKSPFKGKNFMTDEVAGSIKLSNGLYVELSFGRGIFSDYIYGVTVATFEKDYTEELGGCCDTFEEVEEKVKAALEFVVDNPK